jgi:hypothetical protein
LPHQASIAERPGVSGDGEATELGLGRFLSYGGARQTQLTLGSNPFSVGIASAGWSAAGSGGRVAAKLPNYCGAREYEKQFGATFAE